MDEMRLGSVPVAVAARVYGKDVTWIRAGIIVGWLPIGTATRKGKLVTDLREMSCRKGRISYYISPVKLYEQTGYVWKGEKEYVNSNAPRVVPEERRLDPKVSVLGA